MDTKRIPPLLKIDNLCVRYKSEKGMATALNGVGLEIKRAEIVAVVGETGSGKSTLGRTLLDINPGDAETTFDGITFYNQKETLIADIKDFHPLRGSQISMLFQEATVFLNPTMKCGPQIMEALLLDRKCSRKEAKVVVLEALDKIGFNEPERIFNSYPGQISGGQNQRVMLIMATIRKPALLIADEPTSSVDVGTKDTILAYLHDLVKANGMSVMLITHDLSLALKHTDRIIVLSQGHIVDNIATRNFDKSPKHDYTSRLFHSHQILSDSKETPKSEKKGEDFLTVEGLNVFYTSSGGRSLFYNKKKHAVKNVGFSLQKGEVLGILGESGSGKTSLAWCLAGLIRQYSGTIKYHNGELSKGDIQMVFQNPAPALSPMQKVGDAVWEVLRTNKSKYAGDVHRGQVAELFGQVNLDPQLMDRLPEKLSGGEKQRVCIARALATKPQLIIFDEAVSSLDVTVKSDILKLMLSLRNKLNLTCVFISHDFSVIKFVAERVMVMHQGEIIELNSTLQIVQHQDNPVTSKLVLQS